MLEMDQDILSYPNDIQDLFWLFALAENSDIKEFFSSRNSDFAPYILQPLERQNMDEIAHQFSTSMAVYGARYQGFDQDEKTIKAFAIPVTKQELDTIFLNAAIIGAWVENDWRVIPHAWQKRKLEHAMEGDDTSLDRLYRREYELAYAINPKTFAAQKLLANFPSQNEIYRAIYAQMCQNPNLKRWYYEKYNAIPQEQVLSGITLTLIANSKAFGPYEKWPIYYQNIAALVSFQVEMMDTGIFSYFYGSSSEEVNRLLKALKSSNLDDVLQIVEQTKAYHEKLEALRGQFDLSSPKGLAQAEDYLGMSVEEFESDIDIYELNDKIDRAVLTIGLDNKLISR